MWAQDAVAMYGYAGSSAAAATVTPFSSPPETTNSAQRQAKEARLPKPPPAQRAPVHSRR